MLNTELTPPLAIQITQTRIMAGSVFISHLMVSSRDCNMQDGVTILIWTVEDTGIIENMHQVKESIAVVVSHNEMKNCLSLFCMMLKRCWSHRHEFF
jgi:hypothetical protein